MMILECDGSLRMDARTQTHSDRSALLLRLARRSRNLIKRRLTWWTRRGDGHA